MKLWLPNREAACGLAVDVRTIKRWTRDPITRSALGAVRHGKQWRIPFPANRNQWETETRARFAALGLKLAEPWERDFDKKAKEFQRGYLESCRLWLAAFAKVLEQGNPNAKASEQLLWLFEIANAVTCPRSRSDMDVAALKAEFFTALRQRGLGRQEIRAIMRRWPEEHHFELVCGLLTTSQVEEVRQKIDYLQATCLAKRKRLTPTQKTLFRWIHEDFVDHLNDTQERLPYSFVIDMRSPRRGLTRHTGRKRYPRKQAAQTGIPAVIYDIQDKLPGSA